MKAETQLALVWAAACLAANVSAQLIAPPPPASAPQIAPDLPAQPAAQPDESALPAVRESKPTRQDIPSLIAKLNDPSLFVRQAAEQALANVGMSQEQLEEAIQKPSATPEQRLRLEQLGPTVLYQTPRAAMGITYFGETMQVRELHEGFEAQRVLQVGDEILSIAGHSVSNRRDLRHAIVMHPPGTEVTMRVVRQGRPLTLRLKLGSFDSLPQMGWRDSVTIEDCRRAWDLRVSDLREAREKREIASATIDIGVDAAAWERLKQPAPGTSPDPTTMPWGDLTLTAGGSPRESGGEVGRPTLSRFGSGREAVAQRELRRAEDLRRFGELQRRLVMDKLSDDERKKVLAEIDEVAQRVFENMDVDLPVRRP
jgi:hypothetical protein